MFSNPTAAPESAARRILKDRRTGLMIAILIIGILLFSPASVESAGLVASSPSRNETVSGDAVLISLRFDAPVNHEMSRLILKGGKGTRYLKPSLAADPKYLVAATGRLTPGDYELVWVARLPGGKTRSGTIPFTVK